jgi:hypothetical protein
VSDPNTGGLAGKQSAAHAAYADPQQQQQQAVPGKTTRVDQLHPTGNAGIDNGGGACAAQSGTECFLSDKQRTMLISELFARINAAQASYLSALGDLHVDKLIDKEAELPWYLSILLGAAGSLIESGVMGAVKAMKSGGVAHVLSEAGAHGIDEAHAGPIVSGLTEKEVEWIVKTAVDQGKDKAKGPLKGAASESSATDRTQSLSYIDYLRDNSMSVFQHLREDPPGYATDAQLLALFKSFEGSRHTHTMYREKLEAQIKRYMSSHAHAMGRRSGGMFKLETRVAWLVTGGDKRLIYTDRKFSTQRMFGLTPSKAYEGEHALSLQDDASWGTPSTPVQEGIQHHEDPVGDENRMIGYVEPEFVEVALQQQETIWQAAPETLQYDYRYMPPKLIKAGGHP